MSEEVAPDSQTPGSGSRQLKWWVDGPAVEDGTIPVDYVTRVLTNLQGAIRHIAEAVEDESKGRRRGPPKKSIAEQITLRLVATGVGSFHATLELPPPPPQRRMWDVGQEALERLLAALETVAEGGDPTSLPPASIPEIQSLTSLVGDGVTTIGFEGSPLNYHVAKFEAPISLPQHMEPPRFTATVSGRLREVDFKDHTAELYDAAGRMTRVRFAPQQETDLRLAANLHVTIEGELEEDPAGARRTISVESIRSEWQGTEFWRSASLEELARVEPLTEASLSPGDFWPKDLDPEDFLRLIDASQMDRQ